MLKIKRILTVFFATLFLLQLVVGQVQAIKSSDLKSIHGNRVWYWPDQCKAAGPAGNNGSDTATTDIKLPANATVEQKIAQTFMVGFTAAQADIAKQMVQKYHLGGVFVLGKDASSAFTKGFAGELNTAAGTPLLIASDEEGGQIQRFADKIGAFPSAREMASKKDADVEALGKQMGTGLVNLGVNTDLAPVLDILTGNVNNADNLGHPEKSRAFSSDPTVVAAKAGAFAKGLQESHVGAVFKHFPGIGQSSSNTDNGPVTLPSLSNLEKKDILPYKSLVSTSDAAVMLSNAFVPDWGNTPTSINSKAVSYLRSNLDFKGLVMTDDLLAISKSSYGNRAVSLPNAIVKSLVAGADMPLFTFTNESDLQSAINQAKTAVNDTRLSAAVADVISYKTATINGGQSSPSISPCCNQSNTSAVAGTADTSTPTNKDYQGNQILNNAQMTAIQQNQQIYQQAAEQAGIPWQMLAVVHLREHGLQVSNPDNGQGIYQFADMHGGPYPGGPVSQAEFLRQSVLAAQFLAGKATAANYPNHRKLSLNSDADTVKDTFFSYNGRASAYVQQAVSLGFNGDTQGYEGSPYVMNKADAKRDPASNATGWGQIKTDGGGLSYPANGDYGAFVEYGAIAGVPAGSSCGTVGAVSCTSTTSGAGLSEVRQKVVCLAQAEQKLWDSGAMKIGFRANSKDSFSKYSENSNELWCADFVSWIYKQAGYPLGEGSAWRVAAVVNVQGVGLKNEKFHWHTAGSYAPKPGDIVVHLQGGTSHVNIVTSNVNASLTMVGGDQYNKALGDATDYPASSVVSTYSARGTSGVDDITGYVSPD